MSETPRSEKVKNYLIGIGALTGLILGLLAQFKGEPVAEKAWRTLRDQVNKQTELINDLYVQFEVLKAVQEARASVTIEHEIEELRKQYGSLEEEKHEPDRQRKKPKTVYKPVTRELGEAKLKQLAAEFQTEKLVQQYIENDIPEQEMLEALPNSLEEASKR